VKITQEDIAVKLNVSQDKNINFSAVKSRLLLFAALFKCSQKGALTLWNQ